MKWFCVLLLLSSLPAWSVNNFFVTTFFNKNSSWVSNGSTLDLDFTKNRYYLNGVTYNTFTDFKTAVGATFTRASTGTYTNAAGVITSAASDEPRFEYDPATREAKGILIEEARTNETINSSSIGGAGWTLSGLTITSDAGVAPDGTTTAELVTATGAGLTYFKGSVPAHVANTPVTISLYVKAGTSSKIFFEYTTNRTTTPSVIKGASFDLSNLSVTTLGGTTAAIHKVGNGWYRLVASRTFVKASNDDSWSAFYVDTFGTAPAGMSLYVWGAQTEIGPNATTYIPTAGVAATRAADNFYFPTAGWFNATIGTFFSRGYGESNNNQKCCGRHVAGDGPKAFLGFQTTLFNQGNAWNGTTSIVVTGSTTTASIKTPIKMAFGWDTNALTATLGISGGVLKNSTFAGDWTSTNIYPGGSSYNRLNAPLQRMTFFPKRLTDGAIKNLVQ